MQLHSELSPLQGKIELPTLTTSAVALGLSPLQGKIDPRQHLHLHSELSSLQGKIELPTLTTSAVIFRVKSLIPLFHTGHESPELPRIDFLLIRGDS